MNIALVGNQNCGKTTLFNQLTGSKQHIGNFPGVTVEQKSGYLLGNKDVTVVDLPGIYSLTPYSIEEIVTRDYIFNRKPDCIINIIDATNLERNLYLTIQLLEMEIPFVMALNMMDEVRLNGTSIDVKKLSEELGVPVVPISASKNEGVSELAEVALGRAKVKNSAYHDLCDGAVHKAVHSLAHLLEENAEKCGFPPKYAAIKVIENDKSIIDKLKLDERQLDIIGHIVEDMEIACDTDREAAIVDMRYDYIEALCAKVVLKKGQNVNQEKSMKLDRILTHKIWAIPIFLCVMLAVFFLSFSLVGKWLSDLLTLGIDWLTGVVDGALTSAGISEWLHSLLIDGVFNGVGSVLSFVPTIMVLFFLLSILEDSGYMARVAFVMDKLLRKIGLSGKSFVPMLIGFGCSVPGILAARTVSSERDRKMTVLLVPFMSCSAKLPIYSLITMAFFPRYQALVMLGVYVLSMVVGVLYGLLLKVTVFKGNPVPFVMELPNYRWPSLKTLLRNSWEKGKSFIRKAFTVIFVATLVIWFLQSVDTTFNFTSDSSVSILAEIGRFLSPVFAPLGLGDWRLTTSIITGLTAKEAVVSTLAVLFGVASESLSAVLSAAFSPLQGFCFLAFVVLYMPCVAAVAAVRKELGSGWKAALAMFSQTVVAYLVTLIIYNVGTLFV
ncbi:MAG TPA: ferrous iron transport protein B [Firmicutes bacterium]|nr:ferrous iron transport protein B [Bacillota bacterium]